MDHKIIVDEWFEVEMSTRKSTMARRIDELVDKLKPHDMVIVSELSRLARSIKETLNLIEIIVQKKQARFVCIKQQLDLDSNNNNDITNKVLITMFSMLAEIERDFVSERTKEALKGLKTKGIKLGKPKGIIQASMYDKDKDRIMHLYEMGIPLKKIRHTHLKYGGRSSLREFIYKHNRGSANFS